MTGSKFTEYNTLYNEIEKWGTENGIKYDSVHIIAAMMIDQLYLDEQDDGLTKDLFKFTDPSDVKKETFVGHGDFALPPFNFTLEQLELYMEVDSSDNLSDPRLIEYNTLYSEIDQWGEDNDIEYDTVTSLV